MFRLSGMFVVVFLLIASVQVFASLPTYHGSLTSANGGLVGTGSWVDKALLKPKDQADWFAPTLAWTVTQLPNLTWRYSYTLTVFESSPSHMIVETSESFGRANLSNPQGSYQTIEYGYFLPGGSTNPNMPSQVHGVKFDSTSANPLTISFTSDRAPIWGDFYSKDGVTGGVWNAVWNAGFTANDVDPAAPVGNGSYLNHVLVPDTTTTVPEPASFAGLAAGLLGLAGVRRRR